MKVALKMLFQSKIFRYFVSAGLATWVDICVYFLAYNYIYKKLDFDLFTIGSAKAENSFDAFSLSKPDFFGSSTIAVATFVIGDLLLL